MRSCVRGRWLVHWECKPAAATREGSRGGGRGQPTCQSRNVVWEGQGASVPRSGWSWPCRRSMGDGVSPLTTQRRIPPVLQHSATNERGRAGSAAHPNFAVEVGSWGWLSHLPPLVFQDGAVWGSNTPDRHASRAVRPVLCLRGETAAAARRPATDKPQRRRREDCAVSASWRRGHRGSPRMAAVHHKKCVSSVGGAAVTTNGI